VFRSAHQENTAQYCAVTPNFEYWSASGPYGDAADLERRKNINGGPPSGTAL
jgi:hypothetical protein